MQAIQAKGNIKLQSYFFIKVGNAFKKIFTTDILYLEAALNYTTVHTHDQKYMVRGNLKQVYSWLPDDIFLRIHKCYVVNKDHITNFDYSSVCINDRELPLGRTRQGTVFSHFRIVQ